MSKPRTTTNPANEPEKPTFEASMKRLGEIVGILERGEMPLEASLALFEEGVKLSRESQSRLDSAYKRVELLLSVDPSGAPKTSPFLDEEP